MEQRHEAGYFMQMNEQERTVYDEVETEYKLKRRAEDKEWDEHRKETKEKGNFNSLTEEEKRDLMKEFDEKRAKHMK